MRIKAIDAIPVRTPMRVFGDAFTDYDKGEFVLAIIRTDEDILGYGEAPCSVSYGFYGESVDSVVACIKKYIAPMLIGQDPMNIRSLTLSLDNLAIMGTFLARTAVDSALYDIIGKALNVPLHVLFGGKQRESIKVASELGAGTIDQVVKEAQRVIDLGFRAIKMKAGRNVHQEMEALKAIRKSVGHEIEIRIEIPTVGGQEMTPLKR